MENDKILKSGKGENQIRISERWLMSKKEDEAVRLMSHEDAGRIKKLWKIANGKSSPNYTKEEK